MTLSKFFGLGCTVILPFIASAIWAEVRSGDSNLDRVIEKANSEWAAAMKTGDAATIAAPYADDGVFIGIDGSCTKGRAEIEKMYRARFERTGLAVSTKIEPRHVTLDGDFAYEFGYGEVAIKKGGAMTVNGGRYLTVWQRHSGEWRILRNVVLP
jgi:uncharacterized protein (TIGR02246 family)